jgi:hypothetical protein
MDWLNLRRLEPHFLVNRLASRQANWLIDPVNFLRPGLLAFDRGT